MQVVALEQMEQFETQGSHAPIFKKYPKLQEKHFVLLHDAQLLTHFVQEMFELAT
jgi:hypothetical protein